MKKSSAQNFTKADLERFAQKDALFAERLAAGVWPADDCKGCKGGACCQRHHHHIGDCCTHCGNDEREL